MQSQSILSRRQVLGSALILAAGAAGTAGVLFTGPSGSAQAAEGEADTTSLKGKAAPAFELTTIDDRNVKLADFKGKVILIDFWATWCGPCVRSMPHIYKLATDEELAKKGLVVLAVNAEEAPQKVKAFLSAKSYEKLIVPMDAKGKMAADYRVIGYPTTVVIGKDGKVRDVFIGMSDALDKSLQNALAAK